MATEVIDGETVQKLFDQLEAQKSILSTCTDLYKTLTSHYSSLEQSLSQQYQTLDSKIETLQSESLETLSSLDQREQSIPDRREAISAEIEALKDASLAHLDNPVSKENAELVDTLRSLCRRMDAPGLLRFLVSNRKEAQGLKGEIAGALKGCVDPQTLVLDMVELFVRLKGGKKAGGGGGGGLTDRRTMCGMVVSGLLPPEELKEAWVNKQKVGPGLGPGPAFADRIVQKAKNVIQEWMEKVEDNGGLMNGVGPAEVATFLQLVIGFGLKEEFDQAFLKKMALEFGMARKDMPKLAVPIFGEKIGDVVDELLNNGKDIQAIYFAHEAGLTGKHHSITMANAYLDRSRKNASDAQNKGNIDESIYLETTATKLIIRSVEELGLDEQIPIINLKRRLTALDKQKTERKRKSGAAVKRSHGHGHGHGHGSSSSRRASTKSPSRPAKAARISNPYSSYAHSNPNPVPNHAPVSRYPAPYNYPTQAAYDPSPPAAAPYAPVYGGSHAPSSSAVHPQQHYLAPDTSGAGSAPRAAYGAQSSYGSYDMAAAAATATPVAPAPAYQPPYQHSYTQ